MRRMEPELNVQKGNLFIETLTKTKFIVKRAYAHHIQPIRTRIWDVEHFIFRDKDGRPLHVAVVVLDNGDAFVGRAKLDNGKLDHYNRRNGFNMAVGRALKRASRGDITWWAPIQPLHTGVLLRDHVRNKLTDLGFWKKGNEN